MNRGGIIFSLEAAISLLSLAAILIAIGNSANNNDSMEEIIIFQKENDLLKAWAKEGMPDEAGMQADFLLAFPANSGKIIVNGKKTQIGSEKEKAIASGITIFSKSHEKTEITLIVFY